jgi:hypothetical protein
MLKTMNGEQPQAKSNKQGAAPQIKATTQARTSQKQKKKNTQLKYYKLQTLQQKAKKQK